MHADTIPRDPKSQVHAGPETLRQDLTSCLCWSICVDELFLLAPCLNKVLADGFSTNLKKLQVWHLRDSLCSTGASGFSKKCWNKLNVVDLGIVNPFQKIW